MLPRVISGESRQEDIVIYGPDWYRKNDISLILEEEVTDLDLGKKQAKSAGGHNYPFDRLLIATGSRCYVPAVTGVDGPGVFTLRSLGDARLIKEYAGRSKTAVIVGAGVLGMEAAAALTKHGIKASLIEFAPWILPRQLDATGAALLQKLMEDRLGFRFCLNSQVQAIKRDGQAGGVVLASGEELPGDLVLISAGVRPNVELAGKAGLAVARGVVVDDRMETSVKGVFAAGDVAEHRGTVYGIIGAAQRQGEVAGINMAGGAETYEGTTQSNALNVLGVSLVSAGDIDPEAKHPTLVRTDEARGVYRKLVLKDDVLAGCILLNDTRGSAEILKAIEKKRNVRQFKDALLDDNFDYRSIA
ncbi:MAG: NAD(P)/FAD-dependent oxidoreductase [Chloroflexi bacterium]|nr:NAD(P)/FAD-dependent oxidoreductase [Chloroflexota bacterium]